MPTGRVIGLRMLANFKSPIMAFSRHNVCGVRLKAGDADVSRSADSRVTERVEIDMEPIGNSAFEGPSNRPTFIGYVLTFIAFNSRIVYSQI